MNNKIDRRLSLDFVLKALQVMQDLNDELKRTHGESSYTLNADANIELLRQAAHERLVAKPKLSS
jgi:hypothetical protein